MRLWHQELIKYLPRQQLLGQHRECCALRGKGWNKKHNVVDYIFKYSPYKLFMYHLLVMNEMYQRNYKVNKLWLHSLYRGKNEIAYLELEPINCGIKIYNEHDDQYLKECLLNLRSKGIIINLNDERKSQTKI